MNRFVSMAGAGVLALALSLSFSTPSSADPAGAAIGAGLAGGMLGFMAGAAVAGSGPHYRAYDDGYGGGSFGWRHHVRACLRAYGEDYDPASDTFIGDDGYEHRCRF